MVTLFCDIKGILCNKEISSTKEMFEKEAIDKELVSNLNKVILEYGAKLVLTCPWKDKEEFFSIGQNLEAYGLIPNSILSAIPKEVHKMDGILIWLQNHQGHVSNFIVIDTDLPEINKTPLSKKFVKINPEKGFTEEESQKAKKILSL